VLEEEHQNDDLIAAGTVRRHSESDDSVTERLRRT